MSSQTYINPYYDQNFFSFFYQLMIRFFGFVSGKLSYSDFASDEIQLLVLALIAISAALAGSFLVLRRMTMLANALSHTILIGIIAVYVFSSSDVLANSEHRHDLNIQMMLLASVGMGIATTFLTEFLSRTVKLQEDASIGLVFTSLFALGIILATLLTRNAHIGTEVVMGDVDALHIDDVKLSFWILMGNLILIFLFFKEYKISTFDPGLSKALGISPIFYSYLLMTQTSMTAVGAFRAVGVLMVLAFITVPPLSARLLTNRLKPMLFISSGIGIAASFIGIALSRHLLSVNGIALSTGGLVVTVLFFCYLVIAGINLIKNRIFAKNLSLGREI